MGRKRKDDNLVTKSALRYRRWYENEANRKKVLANKLLYNLRHNKTRSIKRGTNYVPRISTLEKHDLSMDDAKLIASNAPVRYELEFNTLLDIFMKYGVTPAGLKEPPNNNIIPPGFGEFPRAPPVVLPGPSTSSRVTRQQVQATLADSSEGEPAIQAIRVRNLTLTGLISQVQTMWETNFNGPRQIRNLIKVSSTDAIAKRFTDGLKNFKNAGIQMVDETTKDYIKKAYTKENVEKVLKYLRSYHVNEKSYAFHLNTITAPIHWLSHISDVEEVIGSQVVKRLAAKNKLQKAVTQEIVNNPNLRITVPLWTQILERNPIPIVRTDVPSDKKGKQKFLYEQHQLANTALLRLLYLHAEGVVRDNFGKMRIVFGVKKQQAAKLGMERKINFYDLSTNEIILNDYKTVKKHGTLSWKMDKRVPDVVRKSLKLRGIPAPPPKANQGHANITRYKLNSEEPVYLIVKPSGNDNNVIYGGELSKGNQGHLSTQVKAAIGVNINTLRHSFAHHIQNVAQPPYKAEELDEIATKRMGHTLQTNYQYQAVDIKDFDTKAKMPELG